MKYPLSNTFDKTAMSPSVWREWIEIFCVSERSANVLASPSVWREWIEIHVLQ